MCGPENSFTVNDTQDPYNMKFGAKGRCIIVPQYIISRCLVQVRPRAVARLRTYEPDNMFSRYQGLCRGLCMPIMKKEGVGYQVLKKIRVQLTKAKIPA